MSTVNKGKKTAAAKVGAGKRVAAPPTAGTKAAAAKPAGKATFHDEHSHLFQAKKRVFSIGGALPPKRDLTHFVRWPRYVRLQRQRAILKKRLKVPPSINQFSRALDKNQASTLFRLLAHYRPESKEEKMQRLKAAAQEEVKGNPKQPTKTEKPMFIKQGLNHVTNLIESKKAKLVVIAHDVDPIELVVWLPALCRKMNVPYCIVKGKARLGHLVYKKTTSCLAITDVKREDAAKLEQFVQNVRVQFNDNVAERKRWGGGIVGVKAQHVLKKRERQAARDLAAKLK